LTIFVNNFFFNRENSFAASVLYFWAFRLFYTLASAMSIIVVGQVFKTKLSEKLKIILAAYIIIGIFQLLLNNSALLVILSLIPIIIYAWFIVSSWKTLKGAQWVIVGGIFVAMSLSLLYFILYIKFGTDFFPGSLLVTTGVMLSFPLSLLVYVAVRVKEIISEVQENAQQIVQLSEEKKEQALKQQKLLEEEVANQTKELRTSFENLKATQSQLIQSEKMASLGELTAGIAHEIQNPLNFVNNFSEVNTELIDE
jgi:signal transduction histidine kinase